MFSLNKNYNVYSLVTYFARLGRIRSNFVKNAFTSSFSAQQNAKILDTLNQSSPEELSNYNIPLARIQTLTNWKSKKGPFKNLSEVLEVEGFGENILKEIGECIAYHKDFKGVKTTKPKSNKRIKHLVVPDISHNILSSLNSAVAIHLEPTGIGWARFEKHNNILTSWLFEDFSSLPQKMMPVDSFNLALHILQKTPPSDVYVFEAQNGLGLQAQSKKSAVSTYNQKMELISMLLALINTSIIHNLSLQRLAGQEPLQEIVNRVFFLKYNIPARLFRTLIGSEKVSAVTAINGLLSDDLKVRDPLPYTPVTFEDNVKRAFLNQNSRDKELMAQALMLGISFMDLYVRRNSVSFEALNFNKKKQMKSD